jgi:hypothetical protein
MPIFFGAALALLGGAFWVATRAGGRQDWRSLTTFDRDDGGEAAYVDLVKNARAKRCCFELVLYGMDGQEEIYEGFSSPEDAWAFLLSDLATGYQWGRALWRVTLAVTNEAGDSYHLAEVSPGEVCVEGGLDEPANCAYDTVGCAPGKVRLALVSFRTEALRGSPWHPQGLYGHRTSVCVNFSNPGV